MFRKLDISQLHFQWKLIKKQNKNTKKEKQTKKQILDLQSYCYQKKEKQKKKDC